MKKIRLIIVDDDASFSRRASEYLSATHEIDVVGRASDGFDAGRLIMRERPDAVVLDLVLRRINSLSLLRSIRAQSMCPSLIVCSAFLSDTSIGLARNLGVDFFVGKPVSLAHLHECIVDTVSVKRRIEEEARALESLDTPVSASAEVHRVLISTGISPRLSGFFWLPKLCW
jgi:DNA-binding NarL/FixJ family response regulator